MPKEKSNHRRRSPLHPLVEEAGDLFKNNGYTYEGMLGFRGKREPLNIYVSPQCIDRALLIANMFLTGAERRGHCVIAPSEDYEPATILAYGETLGVRIWEKRNRVDVDKEKRQWGAQTELIPSGVLRLTIFEPPWKGYGQKKRWEDGPKKGNLEHQMNLILDGIQVVADAIKQDRADLEERRRLRAIKEEQQRKEEAERRKEEARRTKLQDDARLWEECIRMRAFVDAVEDAVREQGHLIESESELGRWIRWARAYIDVIDPIRAILSDEVTS